MISTPQKLHLVRGNSHERKTYSKVKELLGGTPVDFLLIDGDHSYPGVKQDFIQFRDLVRPGGLIAFHDILANSSDPDIDVFRCWEEVKRDYLTEEIINDRNQGKFGIGILTVPDRW
jgi:predicted O-methyltransferase YrrM